MREKVNSSNITSIGYEAKTKSLEVEFVSGGIYRYEGISKALYEKMVNTDSKGRFFFSDIKGKFPHKKLN